MLNFCVYYGWLTIIHDWSTYDFVIFADLHPARRNRLEDLLVEVPETYFYLDAKGILHQRKSFEDILEELARLKVSGVFLDQFNTKELSANAALFGIQSLRSRNFKIIGNGEIEPQYFPLIDYYMCEGFLGSYVGRPDDFQLEFAPFTPTETKIRQLKNNGARIIALSYGEENNLELEKYCYLAALLFDLEAFYYTHPSLMIPSVSNVRYNLGNPLDRYHLKKGKLIREFEYGTIIIDPHKREGSIAQTG
ncbi:MAG: hypothetical protein ACE5R6_19395 [Candidatus Heimdallarchaeota archaeon]